MGISAFRLVVRMRLWQTCALLSCAAAASCRRSNQPMAHVPSMAVAYDMRPLAPDSLTEDVQMRRRTLAMPAGELAARVKSFAYSAQSTVAIEQDGNTLVQEQTDTQLSWDAHDNVHLSVVGSRHALELFAVGDKAYIRLDKGHLRVKGRRDVEVPQMVEAAFAGLKGAFEALPGATLGPGAQEGSGEASLWSYAVRAGDANANADAAAASPHARVLFPPGALPTPTPSVWPSQVKKTEIAGKLSCDAEHGGVVRAKLTGTLLLPGPNDRPMTVRISHRHALRDVGQLRPIAEPEGAVSEFRRPIRQRDPLQFFKEHLQAPSSPRR